MSHDDTSTFTSRIARHQLAIAFVLAGLITNAADVWVTLQVVELETNPIVLELGWGPWVAIKAAALVGVVAAWWLSREHRFSTAAAAGPAVVGLVGLAGNAPVLGWHLTDPGQWAIAALAGSVLVVAAGVIGVGRLARGVDAAIVRGRPVARRAAPVAIAVLMVTSTMGGFALIGTQPLADGQSGTASADTDTHGLDNQTIGNNNLNMQTAAELGDTVYSGADDDTVKAIDAETGEEQWTFSGHSDNVNSVSVSPDGSTVYSGSYDNTVKAIDAETGEEQWTFSGHSENVKSLSASPDGNTVYSGSRDGVKAIDAETGEEQWTFSGHSGAVASLSASPDGSTVFSGSYSGTVKAIDAETGEEQWTFSGHSDGVDSVSASSDGGTVYSGAFDGTMKAIDAETGEEQWTFSGHSDGVTSLSASPDGSTVYSGSNDNTVKAIDAETGGEQWTFSGHSTFVGTVSASSDGGTVYSGSGNGTVKAIDAETGEEQWTFSGHSGIVYSVSTVRSYSSSSGGADLNGTVRDTTGQPVENATVTVTGVDRQNLDVDPSELNATASEILNEAENARPPNFSLDRSLASSEGLFRNADTAYVAAHAKGDWGLTAFQDEPQLGNPSVQLPADEEIALSVWDPTDGGIVQDGVNGDLPGSVVDDTDIVVESIDHAGGTVDTRTIETDTTYDVTFGGSHDLATTNLPAGFYRVYPEGSPETAYTIVVGDPESIANTIRTDLRNEAGQLTEQAQQARDFLDRDVLKQYKTTTNENGSFSVDVPDSVTRVSVQAHKAPPGLDQDPTNASLQDVREFYAVTEYNGSYVMPAEAGTFSVPANDITVDVVETEAPQFADLGRFQNASDQFRSMLQNLSYSDLPTSIQQRLSGLDRERLEETAQKLQNLTSENSELESRVEELMNRDLSEINGSTNAELREQIQAQQQAINELRSTIEAGETSAEVAEGIAQSSATFSEALSEEQIRVIANYPNGTSREVPSKFLTLDQSAATIVGQGGTDVAVEDYPVGDASGVTFDYVVVTENGLGETTTAAQDPTTDSIGLDALSLSSLRPGPDEQVDVTLVGDDDTQVTSITNVRAVAPDGTELNTTTEGANTATFTTSGQGRHYVEATFETASGEQGTLTHRIAAASNDQAMPPGVRIKDSPFGTLAVVGDGLDSGSVDTSQGGSQIDILTQIGADADAPARMHVYAHSADLPPAATMSISVVRGENQRAVQRHVEVTTHLPAITSENAVLYRGDGALPRSGEGQLASVTTATDETTIVTVTDASGALTLETNNNPGYVERAQWWIDRNTPDIDIPFVGQSTVLPLSELTGAVGWGGPVQASPAPMIETASPAVPA